MYKSIQPQHLYHALGGDGASFCHLLRVFLHVTPPTVSELLHASVEADLGRAARLSHLLQGSACLLGCEQLCSLTTRAEGVAALGDWAAVNSLAKLIAGEYARVTADVLLCLERTEAELALRSLSC